LWDATENHHPKNTEMSRPLCVGFLFLQGINTSEGLLKVCLAIEENFQG